jgi:hypothetical protein
VNTISALFVDGKGCYAGLPGVDVWDEERDARLYPGPHPVVAHPPCKRWCKLAGLVEARYGHKRGEDGGCFASALESVRKWGGVLEHPAYSDAWAAYGLTPPPSSGGWVPADWPEQSGWTCYVEQGRYGHRAKKATWLYAVGVELPSLRWGPGAVSSVSWCSRSNNGRPHLRKSERAATPMEFRDLLLSMARSARRDAA